MSAISLEEVRAARGGLDGGDGIPETASGIPLCPYMTISMAMEGKREDSLPPAPVVE